MELCVSGLHKVSPSHSVTLHQDSCVGAGRELAHCLVSLKPAFGVDVLAEQRKQHDWKEGKHVECYIYFLFSWL